MDGLRGGHDDGLVDVLGRTSARKVAHRSCKALEKRTDGFGTSQTLNEFISDVAYFERGENQHVGFTCDIRVGGFKLGNLGNYGRIGLKLAVEV